MARSAYALPKGECKPVARRLQISTRVRKLPENR